MNAMPTDAEKELKIVMVDLINSTMMPVLYELRTLIERSSTDLRHYMELEADRLISENKKVNDIDKRLLSLEMMLCGDPQKAEDVGLRGEISEIRRWIASRVWLERIIAAAFVVQVMAIIFLLIRDGYFN